MEKEVKPSPEMAEGFSFILPFLTPTIILPTLAAIIAIWGVGTQRAIARRNATLSYITRQESDGDIIKARGIFIKCAKDENMAKWAKLAKEGSEETQAIRTILNEFELMSIGIQKGIIDYEMYSRWHKSGTIQYWNNAAPFIFALRARRKNDMLYHEFEQLVGWLKDNRNPKRNRWFGYFL